MHILTRITPFVLSVVLACGDKSSDDTGGMTTSGGPGPGSASSGEMETGVTPTSGNGETSNGPGSDGTSNGPGSDATSNGPTTDGTSNGPTTDTPGTTTNPPGETGDSSGGAPVGCEGDAPKIRFVTTMGDMVVQLDAVNAPVTVENFVHYVEAGFFDGTIFHRVIPDFVIQGGGFTPGLQMKPTDPPIPLETSPALLHVDGAISMARTNDPNSATSQFFICDGAQPGLDGQYAAFGVLVEGFDVLAAITAVQTTTMGPYMDVPVEDIVVMSATCE